MILRVAKFLLVAAVAGFHTLVVLNNTTDYDSNFQFVRHVMMMDSTFTGNRAMWRAVNTAVLHTAFYFSIIVWESVTMLLCWWGAIQLGRALRESPRAFHAAKKWAIAGLTLSLLMWMAFLSVGGEWFLMWQSKTWNGQEAAFRMFTMVGIVLLLLVQRETEDQA
jgi:predicted small integral membrane protein